MELSNLVDAGLSASLWILSFALSLTSVADMMQNLDNKAGERFPMFHSPAELFWI